MPAIWREPAVATVTSKPAALEGGEDAGVGEERALLGADEAVDGHRAGTEVVGDRGHDPVAHADDEDRREDEREEAANLLAHRGARAIDRGVVGFNRPVSSPTGRTIPRAVEPWIRSAGVVAGEPGATIGPEGN